MWLHLARFSIVALSLVAIEITGVRTHPTQLDIPGCPDLASLPGDLNQLDTEQLSTLKCFCSLVGDEESDNVGSVNVNCIFGSRLEDLGEALMAIDDANQTVHKISLDHVEILPAEDSPTLEEVLSADCIQTLQELEIKDCRGQIIERRENPIVEFSPFPLLESVSIENCGLQSIPAFLLSKTIRLKSLLLAENQIITVQRPDLEAVVGSLELLDLTSNLITVVEPEAISQLKNLRTLLIGEHNYANKSLLHQLGALDKLQVLDMTRMDGLNDLSEIDFVEGNTLKQWILTGCNLKTLNETDFHNLVNLEELDIRVNLLEAIESLAFSQLTKLKTLSLAGNFLREFELTSNLWQGLDQLEFLDLGWNELRSLNSHSFQGLSSLKSLSLRHNEKLKQIEIGAFEGIPQLTFLNLSGTAIKSVKKTSFEKLVALQELHLSDCQLTSIEPGSFEAQSHTLEKVYLNNNRLTRLDSLVLKPLTRLNEINFSNNPWLCDTNIWPVIEWVKKTYISAAESSREFFFQDSNVTLCDRPFSLENVSLVQLKLSDLTTYDESMDTTTPRLESTTTQVDNDAQNVTLVNFEDLFHVIGEEGNDTLDAYEDSKKPKYDINKVRYGQKTTSKNPTNSMFATIAVGLLVVATIIGFLLVVRRNQSGQTNTEKSQNAVTTTV